MISKNIYAEIFFSDKLFVFPVFRSYLECFQKPGFYPKFSVVQKCIFLEIRSKVKKHHISEAGVSFENIVWSVYQDMGWRTHFLHMAANYRLKELLKMYPYPLVFKYIFF